MKRTGSATGFVEMNRMSMNSNANLNTNTNTNYNNVNMNHMNIEDQHMTIEDQSAEENDGGGQTGEGTYRERYSRLLRVGESRLNIPSQTPVLNQSPSTHSRNSRNTALN